MLYLTNQKTLPCNWCGKSYPKKQYEQPLDADMFLDCLQCRDKLDAARTFIGAIRTARRHRWNEAVFGEYCTFCRRFCGSWAEIDHIRPKKQLGSNNIWNLQMLCRHCNRWKGKRMEAELCRIAPGTWYRLGYGKVTPWST